MGIIIRKFSLDGKHYAHLSDGDTGAVELVDDKENPILSFCRRSGMRIDVSSNSQRVGQMYAEHVDGRPAWTFYYKEGNRSVIGADSGSAIYEVSKRHLAGMPAFS